MRGTERKNPMFGLKIHFLKMQVVIALSLIYYTIGPPVFAAMIIMIVYVPFNYGCSAIIRSYQAKQMLAKDNRVKFTKERCMIFCNSLNNWIITPLFGMKSLCKRKLENLLKYSDTTIVLRETVVHGMAVVKMYAWEEAFEKEINRMRKKEVKFLKKATLLTRILQAVNSAAPLLVAIACFSWFVLSSSNNILNPSIAFVALTVFNQLRRPMSIIAPALQFISKAIVCSKRIDDFLQADELKKQHQTERDQVISIDLRNAYFSWSKEKENLKDAPTLMSLQITLKVQQGEFCAVVGSVGSGKSSLLAAILGEMTLLDGSRNVCGTVSYLSQTAWILNQTVRANILYGLDYDRNRYDKILKACELKKDIFALPRCDATVLGENGAALSGGQRTRIALARALYQTFSGHGIIHSVCDTDCDIFLLDDPFSAVDATTASEMYEKLFGSNGLLSEKTTVLVTHSIEFTKNATVIYVMDGTGGKIVDHGTYEELLERSQVFSKIKQDREEEKNQEKILKAPIRVIMVRSNAIPYKIESCSFPSMHITVVSRSRRLKTVMFEPPQPVDSKQVEDVAVGRIKGNVYLTYLRAFSFKWAILFLILLLLRYLMQMNKQIKDELLLNSVTALSSFWLSNWADSNVKAVSYSETTDGLIIFVALGFMTVLLNIIALVSSTFGGIRASIALHQPLIDAIFHAPLTFFEETSIGRILSRLVADIDVIDMPLPINIRLVVDSLIHISTIMFVISISMPLYIVFVVPFIIGYYNEYGIATTLSYCNKYFLPTNIQIKRIESAQRSQLLGVLSQNINGADSIRAYRRN
ncbi:ABC transporter, ATP-binding protein [Dictyocaulus viviparus]|uniref:ABC transporter, ATP-binding protein n=1 Tax=Dictyocaulus viviparus TaxID=29172 RepID=A0A0D8XS99_DICVI|nr:ABC transporter, ATP-binding protein [Dictyocaulus viviparus]